MNLLLYYEEQVVLSRYFVKFKSPYDDMSITNVDFPNIRVETNNITIHPARDPEKVTIHTT
jgi:hypothetical protein